MRLASELLRSAPRARFRCDLAARAARPHVLLGTGRKDLGRGRNDPRGARPRDGSPPRQGRRRRHRLPGPPSSPHSRCPSGSALRWTTSRPRRGPRAVRRSRGSLSSVTVDLDAFDVLTFDCYGTLIDWEAGLLAALRDALPGADEVGDDALLEAYAGHEARGRAAAVPLLPGGARDGPPRRRGRPRPRGGRRRGRALLGERPRLARLPGQRRGARPSARAIPARRDHELRHRSLRGVEREART